MSAMDEVKLVPKPSKEQLNERQLVDYEQHRTEMIQWMLHLGKDPEKAEGYAVSTIPIEGQSEEDLQKVVNRVKSNVKTDIE